MQITTINGPHLIRSPSRLSFSLSAFLLAGTTCNAEISSGSKPFSTIEPSANEIRPQWVVIGPFAFRIFSEGRQSASGPEADGLLCAQCCHLHPIAIVPKAVVPRYLIVMSESGGKQSNHKHLRELGFADFAVNDLSRTNDGLAFGRQESLQPFSVAIDAGQCG